MAAPARETWLYGAIGGLFGAGAMTVLRLAARRSGIIDKMVPQAVEEWAAHHSGLESSGGRFRHHVVDQALHAGYGVMAGAVYGAVQGGSGRHHLACGAAFGATVWLFGAGVVFSLLDVARPIWRSRPAENAVNLAAHVLYGLSVQLVTEELSQQARRVTSDPERHAARVG